MRLHAALLIMTGGLVLCGCRFPFTPQMPADSGNVTAAAEQSIQTNASDEKHILPDLHKFQAETLSGNTFTEADLSAKDVTAIMIWSRASGPSVRDLPDIAKYADTLPDNLCIITWCLDAEIADNSSCIQKYLNQCNYHGITLISATGDLLTLQQALDYTPTTVFVDAKGDMAADPLIGSGEVEARFTQQFQSALDHLKIDQKLR